MRLFTSRTSGQLRDAIAHATQRRRFSRGEDVASSPSRSRRPRRRRSRGPRRDIRPSRDRARAASARSRGRSLRRRPGGSRRTSASSEAPVSSATSARTRRACATTACGRQAQKTSPALSSTPATSAKSWCGESIGRFDSGGGFPRRVPAGVAADSRGWRAEPPRGRSRLGAGRMAARGLLLSARRASPRVSLAGACRLQRTGRFERGEPMHQSVAAAQAARALLRGGRGARGRHRPQARARPDRPRDARHRRHHRDRDLRADGRRRGRSRRARGGRVLRGRRARLCARGPVLRGIRDDDPDLGQRLQLRLRDARRDHRLGDRLGPDPRVRRRRLGGRERLVRATSA